MRNFLIAMGVMVSALAGFVGALAFHHYMYDDTFTPHHLATAWVDGRVYNDHSYPLVPVAEGSKGWFLEFNEWVFSQRFIEWPVLPGERNRQVDEWLASQHAMPDLENHNWFDGRVRDNTKWHIGPIVADDDSPWLHRARATYMDTYEAPNHVGIYGVTVQMHWDLTMDERTYVVTAEPDLSRSKVQRFPYSNH